MSWLLVSRGCLISTPVLHVTRLKAHTATSNYLAHPNMAAWIKLAASFLRFNVKLDISHWFEICLWLLWVEVRRYPNAALAKFSQTYMLPSNDHTPHFTVMPKYPHVQTALFADRSPFHLFVTCHKQLRMPSRTVPKNEQFWRLTIMATACNSNSDRENSQTWLESFICMIRGQLPIARRIACSWNISSERNTTVSTFKPMK